MRHRTFFGVHQQQDAIHHPQGALDFAAEVGVPRRVHQVDLHTVVGHAGVLGSNRDASFTLLVHGIQDALTHLIDLPVRMGLPEHGVHQRRLPVIHVGDDGNIPDVGPTVRRWTSEQMGSVGGGLVVHRVIGSLSVKKKTPLSAGVRRYYT